MNLEKSYDETEEIVKPEMFVEGQKKLPSTAIVYFKKELENYLESSSDFEKYSEIFVSGDENKIYKVKNEDIIIYRTLIGGPITVAMMEELHARGVNTFIIFGSCGKLCQLEKGAFIVPEEAYRDEGTSFHYAPESEFIKVETAKKLEEIFKKNNISYEVAKTWTTDALYRETVGKMEDKLKLGCKVVDMECASIMAFAKLRGVKAYQFLYTEDTLENKSWDMNKLKEDRSFILKECLDIAIKVAEEI